MADNSQRVSTCWHEELDILISWRWFESVKSSGQIFELTGTGYKKVDWLKEDMRIDTGFEPLNGLKEYE